MKSLPIDIFSIKEYGIKKWHNNFYWPVNESEYANLFDDIEKLYLHEICNSETEIQDSLWVLYNTIIGISLLSYSQLVIQRLHDLGYTIQYRVDNRPQVTKGIISVTEYYEMLIKDKPINKLFGKPLPEIPNLKRRAVDKLRIYHGFVQKHGFTKVPIIKRDLGSFYLTADSISNEMEEFALSQGKKIRQISRSSLVPLRFKKVKPSLDIRQTVANFMKGLNEINSDHKINFTKNHYDNLDYLLSYSVQYVTTYVQGIRQKLSKLEPTSILVMRLGDIFQRCLCVAGKNEAYNIIGFPHGNDIGAIEGSREPFGRPYILFGVVDTFVATNDKSAELFSYTIEKCLKPYGRDIKVTALKKNKYIRMKKSVSSHSKVSPNNIESIMMVEEGIIPHNQPWPYRLDLALRIGISLRNISGLKTIIKAHPDRIKESTGIYDDYFDEFIETPFEKIYNRADAYIFSTTRSTVFNFAILINKPIILLELALNELQKSVQDSLIKRCIIIPTWMEDDRIFFDEQSLVKAILRKPEEIDTEYVNKYLLG